MWKRKEIEEIQSYNYSKYSRNLKPPRGFHIFMNMDNPEKYSRGELAQLARRRMIQKDHGDKSKFNKKTKHKKKWDEKI